MTPPPALPMLYHITHVDNLRAMATDGELRCDAEITARGGPAQAIGMSAISHPGTRVGDYVPFYFCPRSVMLYVIHCANHSELTYRRGQEPIVHLEADLHAVVQWAKRTGTRWAFSLSNAGAYYTEFRSRVQELDQLDWPAITAADFRPAEVKERKQAEFLAHDRLPFSLVERVGVCSATVQARAAAAFAGMDHEPPIEVLSEWYF